VPLPASDEPPAHVLMTTSMGEIVIELDRARAPVSCANFLSYVDKGFYSGTIFHRVMPTFMIQGGGFTSDMVQKPTDPAITNEWRNGLKNVRGTIAMARLGGNPDSATSQFFINVVNNSGLDQPQRDGAAYAVFGRVLAGMQTVDAIRAVTTGNRGSHQNVPIEPVLIERVNRLTPEQAQAKVEAEQARAAEPPAGSATQPGE
jgi:peptidyl-prolyl cis-trans isomerase A (cyclophilin A)